MAACVLSLHAGYIAWVIFGALFTRGRPRLAALHVVTLVYGLIVEIFDFWCPLTALEEWLDGEGKVRDRPKPGHARSSISGAASEQAMRRQRSQRSRPSPVTFA